MLVVAKEIARVWGRWDLCWQYLGERSFWRTRGCINPFLHSRRSLIPWNVREVRRLSAGILAWRISRNERNMMRQSWWKNGKGSRWTCWLMLCLLPSFSSIPSVSLPHLQTKTNKPQTNTTIETGHIGQLLPARTAPSWKFPKSSRRQRESRTQDARQLWSQLFHHCDLCERSCQSCGEISSCVAIKDSDDPNKRGQERAASFVNNLIR